MVLLVYLRNINNQSSIFSLFSHPIPKTSKITVLSIPLLTQLNPKASTFRVKCLAQLFQLISKTSEITVVSIPKLTQLNPKASIIHTDIERYSSVISADCKNINNHSRSVPQLSQLTPKKPTLTVIPSLKLGELIAKTPHITIGTPCFF